MDLINRELKNADPDASGDLAAGDRIAPLSTRRVQVSLVVALGLVTLLATISSISSGRSLGGDADARSGASISPPEKHPPVALQVDLNTAPARELSLLPGVGSVLASRIIADREHRGRFESLQDLERVPGIGPKTIDRIQPIAIAHEPPVTGNRMIRVASNP